MNVIDDLIEKRGAREDKQLSTHFHKLRARGTNFVDSERLKALNMNIIFRDKKENINGLQFSDLIAYPIATHIIDPERANPAYDLIEKNFYKSGKRIYGLKVFP